MEIVSKGKVSNEFGKVIYWFVEAKFKSEVSDMLRESGDVKELPNVR